MVKGWSVVWTDISITMATLFQRLADGLYNIWNTLNDSCRMHCPVIQIPAQKKTLTQCWSTVCNADATLKNLWSTSRVYWDVFCNHDHVNVMWCQCRVTLLWRWRNNGRWSWWIRWGDVPCLCMLTWCWRGFGDSLICTSCLGRGVWSHLPLVHDRVGLWRSAPRFITCEWRPSAN